jgi:uncharacterized protein YjbI with pentapeptide repeats
MVTIDEAELLSPEQAEKAWWDAWYTADYSWEGLARKPWWGFYVTESDHLAVVGTNLPYRSICGGVDENYSPNFKRDATIQDYWRLDLTSSQILAESQCFPLLVNGPDGVFYHKVHFPIMGRNYEPTEKLNWKSPEFDDLIIPKLIDLVTQHFCGDQSNSPLNIPDYRAQFQGAVLVSFLTEEPPNEVKINFAQTYFGTPCHFCKNLTESGGYFDQAFFGYDVDFSQSEFRSRSNFNKSIFLRRAIFRGSQFYFGANFAGSLFFGEALFQKVTFGNPNLGPNKVDLFNSKMVIFDRCVFYSKADFGDLVSDVFISFENCHYLSLVKFKLAKFRAKCSFNKSVFYGFVTFNRSPNADITFKGCVFKTDAFFSEAEFNGGVSFESAVFRSEANFNNCRFQTQMDFSHVKFDSVVLFLNAKCFTKINFKNANIAGYADFTDMNWPELDLCWRDAFALATFKSPAIFSGIGSGTRSGSGCGKFAAFSGAKFERGVVIDPGTEASNKRNFDDELRVVLSYPRHTREPLLFSLESGSRVLKQAMTYASDPVREQEFYRFELRARRAQARTEGSEKFTSFVFELVSDYASSIFKPVWWAIGLVPVFGLLYVAVAVSTSTILAGWPIDWKLVGGAMSFSASRLVPFGAFEAVSKDWTGTLAEHRFSGWVLLTLRTLATIQSILSLGLTFLFGLALRRKFQMS